MFPAFFENESLRLIFFGGKGGVGKTTSASASAVWLANHHPAKKFLLISMDPAHSLSDCFEIKIGDKTNAFTKNLFLCEFNAKGALERFKKKYEHQIKLITDRGTYFDNADIDSFFNLSLPGIDEVMGILEIAELIEKHEYDTVIIDTAPTGHTLSMLKLPTILDKWLGVFDLMEGKHHLLQEHFARSRTNDNADDFLKMMHDRLKMVALILRDQLETEFVVVTIPEEIVVAETERLLHSLYELHIPVYNIIINRISKNEGCPYCEKLKNNQQSLIDKIEAKSSYKKIFVPIFPDEVRGVDKLMKFAAILENKIVGNEIRGTRHEARGTIHSPLVQKLPLTTLEQMQLIMVCGKGGVGKTTTAASTSLVMASREPKLKFELYSIDPAHSLGDSFSKTIGEKGISALPNLNVYELDSQKLYKQFQTEYQDAIDGLFDQITTGATHNRGIDFGYDRELIKELLATAPPGLDELMALHKVIPRFGSSTSIETDSPCIIIDTAPTGHFVRFLELPELVRSWLKAIFELLLKYRGAVQLNNVAEKLVSLSRDIRSIINVITNNKISCALIVTIPSAMSLAETKRLVAALDTHKIRSAGIVMNMTTNKETDCDFCASRAHSESKWIKEGHNLCKDMALIPYMIMNIRGIEKLTEFGRMIWR